MTDYEKALKIGDIAQRITKVNFLIDFTWKYITHYDMNISKVQGWMADKELVALIRDHETNKLKAELLQLNNDLKELMTPQNT